MKKKGFTMIELMVSMAVLAILVGVSITLLKPAVFYGKGRDARRKSDLEIVRSALYQYYLDNGRVYPDNTNVYDDLESLLGEYTDVFPHDPLNSGSNVYTYIVDTDSKCYQLSAPLESAGSDYEVCGGSLACQAAQSYCD
ncbi:type II secretion system protein [candidate division WWE3 bacterium]|uniref:Type II secretion system protein n=1 Tax=candidate division WWE3 bacterium TaxID=2053526 RepID=A0A955LJX3_UNCKA|nr:type II secretion system protein [candidate division WWE3 bacterium]